jgi:hypothetical protein
MEAPPYWSRIVCPACKAKMVLHPADFTHPFQCPECHATLTVSRAYFLVIRVVVVAITGLLTYCFAPRNDGFLWFIIATLFATMFVVTSVTVRLFAAPAKRIPPDYRTVLWGPDGDEPPGKK